MIILDYFSFILSVIWALPNSKITMRLWDPELCNLKPSSVGYQREIPLVIHLFESLKAYRTGSYL